jgi:VWFA-related protein
MSIRWAMLRASLAIASLPACLFYPALVRAQKGSPESSSQNTAKDKPSDIPVFRSTTTLVYLDVTVVDKKGNPVVTGLTRDDFTITEDKQPQRIFSFEAPDEHGLSDSDSESDGSAKAVVEGKAPTTILVLDLLNTQYADFAFVRDETRKFLLKQPEELPAPSEMLVLGNTALTVLLKPTRSRQDLLAALDHLPSALPYKIDQPNFMDDLIRQSYDSLQQIAIQYRGVSGRKNVIWIGAGPPNMNEHELSDRDQDVVEQYVRHTVNLMVESRITLFKINPGWIVGASAIETKAQEARIATSADNTDALNPFAGGNQKFSDLVTKTGGVLFNQNNVSVMIQESVDLGSKYYTLTYQPRDGEADARFRQIEVKLRNPNLHVVTKAGYFGREKGELLDSDNQTVNILRDASLATVSFSALNLDVAGVVRHPDTHTAEITLQFNDKKLHWQTQDGGKSSTTVIVTAVSRSGHEDVLARRVAKFYLLAASQDAEKLTGAKPEVKVTLPVPRDTKNVRLALATEGGERIGSVDVDRKTIDAAPVMATPEPRPLRSRGQATQAAK